MLPDAAGGIVLVGLQLGDGLGFAQPRDHYLLDGLGQLIQGVGGLLGVQRVEDLGDALDGRIFQQRGTEVVVELGENLGCRTRRQAHKQLARALERQLNHELDDVARMPMTQHGQDAFALVGLDHAGDLFDHQAVLVETFSRVASDPL